MSCCHYYEFVSGNEQVFAVDPTAIRFGSGVLDEVGETAKRIGMRRCALFTDIRVAKIEAVEAAVQSLKAAGCDVVVYTEVRVEPTDESFKSAARFAAEGCFDGFVSVGGGSVIDTCKAANLYASWPAEFRTYVNAPIGDGQAVPGPLKPHIACPTTSGTGSECTGIAVFDLLEQRVKTGIASRELRPTLALIDPTVTATLPANVVAASGFDVLSHALESYTARPFTQRAKPKNPGQRPMSQGANPYSDIGCIEALKRCGNYLQRAVNDAGDREAREGMMFAAKLAGIAFGNSGVHLPHGMSYSVAGLVSNYRPDGYPDAEAICPHGISVIVDAPAVFRATARACPERHLQAAGWLGGEITGAGPADAGDILAGVLEDLMRNTAMPNGLHAIGYAESDIPALAGGALAQQRLLINAPIDVSKDSLSDIYRSAMTYW